VVAQLKTLEDKEKFVQRWRQHFLDSLQPKFMPEHWSVTHPLLNPHGTRNRKRREEREAMERNNARNSDDLASLLPSGAASTPVFSSTYSYPPLNTNTDGDAVEDERDSEDDDDDDDEDDEEGDNHYSDNDNVGDRGDHSN